MAPESSLRNLFSSNKRPKLPTIKSPPNKYGKEKVKPQDVQRIRESCPQFRVLILGRANSGKTTILKKMCGTDEEPVVHDEDGKEYPASVLNDPNAMRGIHNIDLEIMFPSNPGFILHDSMGFEAGSTNEVDKVKDFIQKRMARRNLRNRLHAIWFCIPTDSNRVAFKAELSFFQESFGDVPIILLFTKWDGRIIDACNELCYDHDMELTLAIEKAPKHAKKILEREYIPVFKNTPYPPASYVVLGYMHQPETKCSDLSEKTAAALPNGILKRLFVSVQTQNLRICIENALDEIISKPIDWREGQIIKDVASWFPHIFLTYHNYNGVPPRFFPERYRSDKWDFIIEPFHPLIASSKQPMACQAQRGLILSASVAIIAHHSFNTRKRTNIDGTVAATKASVEEYLASSQRDAVNSAITSDLFFQYVNHNGTGVRENARKEASEELLKLCMDNLLK